MKTVLEDLSRWYETELADTFPDCWVFGSIIYQEGAQFAPQKSDVDLVVLLPEDSTPTDRIDLYDCLGASVQQLENTLLQSLARTDASSHITSVIPVTLHEIQLDIHKSGKPGVFSGNDFLSLRTGERSSLPAGAASGSPSRVEPLFQAIEKCQSYRNQYVACSVNASRKVCAFDSTDMVPKELARSAAQVADYIRPKPGTNEWDVNEGAWHIMSLLDGRSEESKTITDLRRRCMGRANRGSGPLEPCDIVLLYELLFDQALALQQQTTVSGQVTADVTADPSHEKQEAPDITKRTIVDEGDNERIVWLLPRGFILIEDVQFEESSAWGIVLNYYDAAGSWQQGTHYHPSYRDTWETYEGKRTQLYKLGVPIGDWQFAEGALWLVAKLREKKTPYDIAEALSRIPTAPKYTRYFGPGIPIVLESLDPIYAKWRIPAYFRDVLAHAEDLLLLWDKGPTRGYLQEETRSLRHHSLVAAERLLGKDAPSLRFVQGQIDAYDEDASTTALRKWVDRLRQTLLACLSAYEKK